MSTNYNAPKVVEKWKFTGKCSIITLFDGISSNFLIFNKAHTVKCALIESFSGGVTKKWPRRFVLLIVTGRLKFTTPLK